MGNKKKSLIGLLILFLAMLLVYILGSFSTLPAVTATPGTPDAESNSPSGIGTDQPTETPEAQSQTSGETSSEGSSSPPGTMFVVPEVPLGTLGIISALASAIGMLALKKKGR